MIDQVVEIKENAKVNGKYYKLAFLSKALAKSVRPGQFMNVRVVTDLDPFLRRPFSYYRVTGNRVEILYEVLGKGTKILSSKKPGDELTILGPLGKPFSEKLPKGMKRILVAGGVGVPPTVFLAEKYGCDRLLIGTKSKAEVLPKKELRRVQGKILHSTDDGSYGRKGFITMLLEEILEAEDPKELFIQTCGPKVMMNAVMQLAQKYGVQGEASIDETMACGVGACLGCMVKTKDHGLVTACKKGPVFSFEEVDYEC